MNKKGNTKALNEYNLNKKESTKQRVLDAIEKVYKSNKKFTLEAVCKEANVTRAYFTKNPEMMEIIKKYRTDNYYCKNKNNDSKDVLIKTQAAKIKQLEHENKLLQTNENYKHKYEEALKRINELENILNDRLEDRINDII